MATRRTAASPRRRSPRRTASRATRSARGRREFGVGLAKTARRANYAYPNGAGPDRGKRPSYPIDPRHVRGALSRSAQRGTAGTSRHVRAAIAARYGSVAAGLAANRRWSARHR